MAIAKRLQAAIRTSRKTIHWAARFDPDRWAGYHVRAIARMPDRGYRVRDGFVTLDFLPDQRAAWRALCAEIGLDAFALAKIGSAQLAWKTGSIGQGPSTSGRSPASQRDTSRAAPLI